jgi:hypothetical protein
MIMQNIVLHCTIAQELTERKPLQASLCVCVVGANLFIYISQVD